MSRYLLDTSVWVALVIEDHKHHRLAVAWFDRVTEPESVAFCRATQQSLLRLLTTSAVLAPYGNPPLSNAEAWSLYQALLSDFRISFFGQEPTNIEAIWREYALRPTPSSHLWIDAYLAAFARASDCTLLTVDNGFRQFAGLDVLVLEA